MQRTRIILIVSVMLFSVSFPACRKDKLSGEVVNDPEMISDLYARCNDTITFQTHKYILECSLYRDFFPGGPVQRKSPLVASIHLVNIDSLQIPENLQVTKLYIVNKQQVWISTPGDENNSYVPAFKLYKLSNNGPEWGPGIYVDAIIEVENRLTTDKVFLIARNQNIERIE